MAFGPMEALAVAVAAMFKHQINAVATWPFRAVWRLLRKGRSRKSGGAEATVAGAEIIDITPVSRHIH